MDWFEALTGFSETSYDDTRGRLSVVDDRLHSSVNGKNYGIGRLELASLDELRARVNSQDMIPGQLKASVACPY